MLHRHAMVQVAPERMRAVLVGVQLPSVSDTEHAANLAELGRLVTTLGYEVVAEVSQRRDGLSRAAVLGEGKLEELAELTGGSGVVSSLARQQKSKAKLKWEEAEAEDEEELVDSDADGDLDDSTDDAPTERNAKSAKANIVVVDHDLTPSMIRNLERAAGCEVLDRSGIIVEIFHRHARSREARMQVEIARLAYLAPRLRESGGPSERQAGRGAGDTAIELDRRRIRDRIAELQRELEAIQTSQSERRRARRDQMRIALVGYTNAGKSSMMRALTGSEVLVADKLFATLDTTVRALHPEAKPRILVSDTVGFIQKLPHDLVASFRSTLDEALEASLLFYVVDASDPTFENQLEVTRTTLAEIGASDVPYQLILNKIDRCDEMLRASLRAKYPDALQLSAHRPADVASLRQFIIDYFEREMVDAELTVPYSAQSRVPEIYESARVLEESFDENGRHLKIRALPEAAARLKAGLEKTL